MEGRRDGGGFSARRPATDQVGGGGQPWQSALAADPLPWLLEESTPAVRHLALRDLLDRPGNDPALLEARRAAHLDDPLAAILGAQHPDGYWAQPGSGYGPKYTGTVWQVVFLDQLGADGQDPRVHRACEYLLAHAQTPSGAFGVRWGGDERPPPPSSAAYCLTGNLIRALIGFGWLDDERVQRAIDWLARAVTGDSTVRYYAGSGPLFRCGSNDRLPCAWGAVKAMAALARIPVPRRSETVREAVVQGTEFLLSRDPAVADYPMGYGNTKPSGSWFRLGFPSGYVTDVLQNLEVLCELGHGTDPRLRPAIEWVLSRQDAAGRWRNEYAYNGKTWIDIDRQGAVSKWVTLRACRVLRWSTAES